MNISCVTVDPNDSNKWYLGTGEHYTAGAAVGNSVYETINGGTAWTHVPVNVVGGETLDNPEGAFFINAILA